MPIGRVYKQIPEDLYDALVAFLERLDDGGHDEPSALLDRLNAETRTLSEIVRRRPN